MEIYRLNDEIKSTQEKKFQSSGEKKITDLKQGVKNPERVNVYVNGAYELSLDVAQVVDYKLKVGLVISSELLGELRRASDFGKLYQRTLEWVLLRPRSVRETRDYLRRKNAEFSDQVLERLISRGYLDDRRFAEWWVENRFVKKGVSRKRLAMELMRKGVAREIIDEVLDGRNDEEELKKMIARKRNKYDDEKLIAYLCRQGFSYDLVRKVMEEE